MKNILIILAAILFANTVFFAQVTKNYKVDSGGKLIINNQYGDITITTWDKNEVQLKYDDDEGDAFVKQDGSTINFNLTSDGDGDIHVSVPAMFNISFNSRAGDFKLIKNIAGTVDGYTGGGDVGVSDVYGSIKIRTSGGNFRSGSISGDAEFSSAGGNIKIANIGGRGSISTGGGNIAIESIGSDANVSTAGGNIVIGDVRGNANVNTSGGNITLGSVSGRVGAATSGGNISLKSASGSVSANTGSGNVKLFDVTGNVNVNTASGQVEVHLNPESNSNSQISTTMGDLVLYIPSNARAKINASITYKGWRKDADKENPQLISDYPQSSYTVDKDSRQVYAEYILNGGGNNIRLNAIMGKIKIKKE